MNYYIKKQAIHDLYSDVHSSEALTLPREGGCHSKAMVAYRIFHSKSKKWCFVRPRSSNKLIFAFYTASFSAYDMKNNFKNYYNFPIYCKTIVLLENTIVQ